MVIPTFCNSSSGAPHTKENRQTPKFSLPLLLARQVRHRLGTRIARVIQARQLESAFDRAEQREVIVEHSALQLMKAVVRIDDRDHLVDDRLYRVIVFIPDHHDRIVAVLPNWRSMNGIDDLLQCLIAKGNQCRVRARLRSIVIRVTGQKAVPLLRPC